MAFLTPNSEYKVNGVLVKEKIIPDGTVWKNEAKAKKAGFSVGSLYKKQAKLCGTGIPKGITVHNTSKLAGISSQTTQAEQYTRATYNENMNSSRVHFYVDDKCIWQNLKAGLGLSSNDPKGSAEVSWHSGDGSIADGGNMTNISIEFIMDGWNSEYNQAVIRNGVKLVAYLMKFYNFSIDDIQTHTYWINKKKGVTGSHSYMNTYKIPGVFKYCPYYILPHWNTFLSLIKSELGETHKEEVSESSDVLQIGDIVNFTGNTHYASTNAVKGFQTTAGEAKVTNIYKTGKHPIHLIATKGSKSKVYGWVDPAYVKKISSTAKPTQISIGSKVKIKSSATTYYQNGPKIPDWVKSVTHVVTQVGQKNSHNCALLGKKIQNGSEVAGIMTWVDFDNLTIV